MDHIGDALHLTRHSVGKILASSCTRDIIKIALEDAIKIAETDYEVKQSNFQSYVKKVLSNAVQIVKEYENGGIKRNANGDRMATTIEEQNRDIHYQEAKKNLEKENIDAHDKNWRKKLTPPKKPEFNIDDLEKLLENIETHDFVNGWNQIVPGKIAVCMFNAGHILGSVSPLFRITDAKGENHFVHFSGDIGSYQGNIMPAGLPTAPKNFPIETLLIESTYGGRVREDFDASLKKFEQDLARDIKKYNTIVQACFSLDRLQKILFYTIDMQKRGLIPNNIPILVDSKMGAEYINPYIDEAKKNASRSISSKRARPTRCQYKKFRKFHRLSRSKK
jgi:metallo-beta-lactamase family protein